MKKIKNEIIVLLIFVLLPTFLDTPYKIIPQITLEGTAWYDLYLVFTIIGKDTFHIGGNGAPPIYYFQKDSMLVIAYDGFAEHKTWYVRADTLFIKSDLPNIDDFYDESLKLFKIKVITPEKRMIFYTIPDTDKMYSPQALPFFEMERCYPSKYEDSERFENETEEWKKYFREHGS